MTTKADIKNWFGRGVKQKDMFMFIVCDTFDYEDFPSYSKTLEEARVKYNQYICGANMTKLMEVYDLRKSWDSQDSINRNFAKIE